MNKLSYFLNILFVAQIVAQEINLKKDNVSYRDWWDVQKYELFITPSFEKFFLKATVKIDFVYKQKSTIDTLQLDLHPNMQVDSVFFNNKLISFKDIKREKNFLLIILRNLLPKAEATLKVKFSGNPHIAINPPWDGGWVFEKDSLGNFFVSVACQTDGSWLWFPSKDVWYDKADKGVIMHLITPKNIMGVGNGRLISTISLNDTLTQYSWETKSPINTYNIIPYFGNFSHFSDTLIGLGGVLTLDYWVLTYNLKKAKTHFKQIKPILHVFEKKMGAYPFYKDGYKLVEAPYLGMEHQSNIAYGNKYLEGYLGRDLSGSGWGLGWDFIIVHETGHEWFGNNITAKKITDMWIHESFTTYSEVFWVESFYNIAAGQTYIQGLRKHIQNNKPLIGDQYKKPTGDIYYKGANMIHTLRHWIDNDSIFGDIIQKLSKIYRYQTITSLQLEQTISTLAKKNLKPFFNQYLRSKNIPILEYYFKKEKIYYRWTNTTPDFNLELKTTIGKKISPTLNWQSISYKKPFVIDPNFYIFIKEISHTN